LRKDLTAPKKKLDIFVLIDAFGWELAQRYPFLDDILSHKGPLQTVFGYSSSCDPTILTGTLPQQHGHFSFFVYDPPASPFKSLSPLQLLPTGLANRGRVRNVISRFVGRRLGITGYFQLYNVPFARLSYFDYTEKRDIYQPGGINGGQKTVFDRMRQQNIPFFLSDWHPGEEEAFGGIESAVEAAEVEFAFLFLGGLDGTMHTHGTQGHEVEAKIAAYDTRLRRVLDKAAGRYREVDLHVFSDHGMADVRHLCDLISPIEKLGLVFGRDYAAMYDSTMARFWFMNEAARRDIVGVLQGQQRGRLLSDKDLQAYGCNFKDRRYGELFFLADPGVLICPSYMGQRPIAGMHGYDPGHRDSVASFMSSHQPNPAPARLDDLAGLMLGKVSG
jgi:predicted AlkP superfamily pyrophosphatase or phosphodiesterase